MQTTAPICYNSSYNNQHLHWFLHLKMQLLMCHGSYMLPRCLITEKKYLTACPILSFKDRKNPIFLLQKQFLNSGLCCILSHTSYLTLRNPNFKCKSDSLITLVLSCLYLCSECTRDCLHLWACLFLVLYPHTHLQVTTSVRILLLPMSLAQEVLEALHVVVMSTLSLVMLAVVSIQLELLMSVESNMPTFTRQNDRRSCDMYSNSL